MEMRWHLGLVLQLPHQCICHWIQHLIGPSLQLLHNWHSCLPQACPFKLSPLCQLLLVLTLASKALCCGILSKFYSFSLLWALRMLMSGNTDQQHVLSPPTNAPPAHQHPIHCVHWKMAINSPADPLPQITLVHSCKSDYSFFFFSIL